jgi:hypothetical protein
MKTKNLLILLIVFLGGTLLFSSCEKENSTISNADLDLAEDEALTEAIFNDIMESADIAIYYADGLSLKSTIIVDSCPYLVVTDSTENIRVITIDYGDGCEGFYGNTRAGMIKIVLEGRYMEAYSVRTISLIDYYINGIHVEGTKTVTNNGLNENQNLSFSVELTGGKISTPGGIVITREFSHTRVWVQGSATPRIIWDDVYFISGSASGTTYKGETYSRTITNPLEWAASCRFLKSGTILIEVEGKLPISIDYGNGECDAEAMVTRDGNTRTIILKFHPRVIR